MQTAFDLTRQHDNCGFGLIAHMHGSASRLVIERALISLKSLTHRGGINADGKTGDGCGLLMQIPDTFMRQQAIALQITLPKNYAIAMVFLPRNKQQAEHCSSLLLQMLEERGLSILGWRDVPVNADICGKLAESSRPLIKQIFIQPNAERLAINDFELDLLIARRKTEELLGEQRDFYICSMSASVIVYKGLLLPEDLPQFYVDLQQSSMQSAICVFHQRFSTNTNPHWSLAQPFRLLAHNGEINTIAANRSWAQARRQLLTQGRLAALQDCQQLISMHGSDSMSMDNMLELLIAGGITLPHALRLMIPPAWHKQPLLDMATRAFFEYNSMHMEAWDGPAGIVLTDGRLAACVLDCNGLRPARWVQTSDDLVTLASEVGVWPYKTEDIICKGRLGPGQIFVLDTQTAMIWQSQAIDRDLAGRYPYQRWLHDNASYVESALTELAPFQAWGQSKLLQQQKLFLITLEERNQIIRPLAQFAQEATSSMGDDAAIAVLSKQPRLVSDFFRQRFAQVTNPPIDPLRENIVMSLETCLGAERSLFETTAAHAHRLILTTPVLSPRKFSAITQHEDADFASMVLKSGFDPQEITLQHALERLTAQAITAAQQNKVILVISDEQLSPQELPIASVLAVGAIHTALVKTGLRPQVNLIAASGFARDSHQIAILFGAGATAVYPYLAYQVISDLQNQDQLTVDAATARENYRQAIHKGLLKIISKMGISHMASYRGAMLFEALGLSDEIIQLCFPALTSLVDGANFADLQAQQQFLWQEAQSERQGLRHGGLLKYRPKDELHAFNPEVILSLQQAVQQQDEKQWQYFCRLVNERPITTLRDLWQLQLAPVPLELEQVESIADILQRFDSAGMSLGALAPEAHEALAQAMNELGGRSNSGEGGEDPARYNTNRVSKIKQVASARFGVTPGYLMSAEVIQIKIAQGAKPGEGGQLPGSKVNGLIARLRYAVPGVTLISPPPHHDIYSIEDLAQLIFDLKQVNPKALISVKLVAEAGIGTIACGVAKAHADLLTVSGYDGGTAASPISSIKHAGLPWELGLAEVHQALCINGLRHTMRVQVDGGLKTGLDVIKGAILGAESFGFGTAPMVALGCKYLRICHLNNCAMGITTQDHFLREQCFHGTVETLKNYFTFVAQDVRQYLAQLGVTKLTDLIGRLELLKSLPGETSMQRNLNFQRILTPVTEQSLQQHYDGTVLITADQGEKNQQILTTVAEALAGAGGHYSFTIQNSDRAVGARISGEIARRYGEQGLTKPLQLHFTGVAGQSFGAFNAQGLELYLTGDANDYVGKGMNGGLILLKPASKSRFISHLTPIMGNTCLYGATGGMLLAAGRAGERFAVRNSGALAVVESIGDHGCEYMTGGMVCILGETGVNFAAGMTGGFAYVYDENHHFVDYYNHDLVEITRINNETMEAYRRYLREILQLFTEKTQSVRGQMLLADFNQQVNLFWLVKPKATNFDELLKQIQDAQ